MSTKKKGANHEIERKFLVKNLPVLKGIHPRHCKRYVLYRNSECELRVQEIDDVYEFERKISHSPLDRSGTKISISEGEFDWFAKYSLGVIERDEYNIEDGLTIKVYQGRHDGLIRAEMEFESFDSLKKFKPLEWMGPEITNSPLGQDSKLVQMSEEKFKSELSNYDN